MFECEQAQDEGNGRKDGRQFNWYRGITCDVVSGCTSQGKIERVRWEKGNKFSSRKKVLVIESCQCNDR